MKFKQYDNGSCDIEFSWKERITLFRKGPGTYFKEYDLLIKEEIGKYVLFHPFLKHSVKKIENDIERITIEFNMGQTKESDDYSKVTWINKNEI